MDTTVQPELLSNANLSAIADPRTKVIITFHWSYFAARLSVNVCMLLTSKTTRDAPPDSLSVFAADK